MPPFSRAIIKIVLLAAVVPAVGRCEAGEVPAPEEWEVLVYSWPALIRT